MRLDSKRDSALPCEASRRNNSCQNCCGFSRPRQRWRHHMRMSESLCMREEVCKWRRQYPGSITCSYNFTWKRSGRHFSCSLTILHWPKVFKMINVWWNVCNVMQCKKMIFWRILSILISVVFSSILTGQSMVTVN